MTCRMLHGSLLQWAPAGAESSWSLRVRQRREQFIRMSRGTCPARGARWISANSDLRRYEAGFARQPTIVGVGQHQWRVPSFQHSGQVPFSIVPYVGIAVNCFEVRCLQHDVRGQCIKMFGTSRLPPGLVKPSQGTITGTLPFQMDFRPNGLCATSPCERVNLSDGIQLAFE